MIRPIRCDRCMRLIPRFLSQFQISSRKRWQSASASGQPLRLTRERHCGAPWRKKSELKDVAWRKRRPEERSKKLRIAQKKRPGKKRKRSDCKTTLKRAGWQKKRRGSKERRLKDWKKLNRGLRKNASATSLSRKKLFRRPSYRSHRQDREA